MTAIEQVQWVISRFEGTIFTDTAIDTGGATKFGITQRTLQYYRRQKTGDPNLVVTKDDVRNMDIGEAFDCGYVVFVAESGLVFIVDDAVRLAAIDYAFHSGWVPSIRALQAASGAKVDGVFGPLSRQAVNAGNPDAIVLDVCTERMERMQNFIRKRPDQREWMFGWWSRVTEIQRKATKLV